MKLKTGIHPVADPKQWLSFVHPEQIGISLEFAKRLAAYAKSKGRKLTITSGHRSIEKQRQLYEENCRQHPPAGNGYVAKPGSSWHNYRSAGDIDDQEYWKALHEKGDMQRTAKEQDLAKFGLYLPLNHKDARTVFEWWHIQPIECLGYSGDKTKFLDPDDAIYDPNKKEVASVIDKPILQDKQPQLRVAGKFVEIELVNKDGSLYGPLRAIAEALGKKVYWDAVNKIVDIK